MKRIIIILGIVILPACLIFARLMPWPDTKPPALPLPEAYAEAVQALGQATNQFYCVHANTQIAFSQSGEWLFTFCSTNGVHKDVIIDFDKTVKPRVIHGGVLSY